MPKNPTLKKFTPKFSLPTKPPRFNVNKTIGIAGKIQATHAAQRASGRRGN